MLAEADEVLLLDRSLLVPAHKRDRQGALRKEDLGEATVQRRTQALVSVGYGGILQPRPEVDGELGEPQLRPGTEQHQIRKR